MDLTNPTFFPRSTLNQEVNIISIPRLLTFGGFTFTDQEGADGVSWCQQISLSIFPADALEKPSEIQETFQMHVSTAASIVSTVWCCRFAAMHHDRGDLLLCLKGVLGYIITGDVAFLSCTDGHGPPPLPRPRWVDR